MNTNTHSLEVDAPYEECWRWWEGLARLAEVLPDIERVEECGEGRARWRMASAKPTGRGGASVHWDVAITPAPPGPATPDLDPAATPEPSGAPAAGSLVSGRIAWELVGSTPAAPVSCRGEVTLAALTAGTCRVEFTLAWEWDESAGEQTNEESLPTLLHQPRTKLERCLWLFRERISEGGGVRPDLTEVPPPRRAVHPFAVIPENPGNSPTYPARHTPTHHTPTHHTPTHHARTHHAHPDPDPDPLHHDPLHHDPLHHDPLHHDPASPRVSSSESSDGERAGGHYGDEERDVRHENENALSEAYPGDIHPHRLGDPQSTSSGAEY